MFSIIQHLETRFLFVRLTAPGFYLAENLALGVRGKKAYQREKMYRKFFPLLATKRAAHPDSRAR